MGGGYCLTGDGLLKMLAIHVRVRCGIPVVLMGECGCGKSHLVRYLCEYIGSKLVALDVHGGTTAEEIVQTLEHAEQLCVEREARIAETALDGSGATAATSRLAAAQESRVMVFFDELNTCAHVSLMVEAMTLRSIYGRPLHPGLEILAAVNPYRLRATIDSGADHAGLSLGSPLGSFDNPMADLVYRVNPVPDSLAQFVFDFGALGPKEEEQYTRRMLERELRSLIKVGVEVDKMDANCALSLLTSSQAFVRKAEAELNAVSLRDIKRCMDLLQFFIARVSNSNSRGDSTKRPAVSPLAGSMVLAIAFVYALRLPSAASRQAYWDAMAAALRYQQLGRPKAFDKSGFAPLGKDGGALQKVFASVQKRFVSHVEVEEGIAMNEALSENVFVTIICVLNKLPLFIIGKPGTSKTLTLTAIASNLQGDLSPSPFFRSFPAVHLIQYQCSPLSSSEAIRRQFEMACRYQEHAKDTVTVLLLDEVGLAELSPDMPLKVLHQILVNPPIGIVGLSNFALDPAKMNRAVGIRRSEPSPVDVELTAQSIVKLHQRHLPVATPTGAALGMAGDELISGADDAAASKPHCPLVPSKQKSGGRTIGWLEPIALAYHDVYTSQQGRDYLGMRDFYALVKMLRAKLGNNSELDLETLLFCVGRNFSGNPDLLRRVLEAFNRRCFCDGEYIPSPAFAGIREGFAYENGARGLGYYRQAHFSSDELASQLPPVTALIGSNLADMGSCRHLMLLTRNIAALPLLFSLGLLQEGEVDVLFGSRFAEDLSDLHMVKQVNKVKVCMAEGRTVILVNHDAIYESLYDVLNQRYLIKKDAATGRSQRLLRLAIGARSQLCVCHPHFRLLVVVEADHAYSKLDLPLLNRFEKQVLTAVEVLQTPAERAACAELRAWVDKIMEESGVADIGQIFCGHHEAMLPSCVLQHWTSAGAAQPARLAMRAALLRISRPLAVRHSQTLAGAPGGSDYFEQHRSFSRAMRYFVAPERERSLFSYCRRRPLNTCTVCSTFPAYCQMASSSS